MISTEVGGKTLMLHIFCEGPLSLQSGRIGTSRIYHESWIYVEQRPQAVYLVHVGDSPAQLYGDCNTPEGPSMAHSPAFTIKIIQM